MELSVLTVLATIAAILAIIAIVQGSHILGVAVLLLAVAIIVGG